jgi:opacity protein-like surface antigen
MKRTAVSLLTLALFLFTATAYASPYVKGKIGPYFPEENEFDTGFNIEASMGAMLGDLFPDLVQGNLHLKRISTEVGIGYYHSSFDEKETLFGTTASVEGDLDVVPITLTALYNLPVQGTDFELFGGVGLGLYMAFVDAEAKISDPILGSFKTSDDDNELEFGTDFHLGATYNINPQLGVQAEFEYDSVTDDVGGSFLNFGVKYKY